MPGGAGSDEHGGQQGPPGSSAGYWPADQRTLASELKLSINGPFDDVAKVILGTELLAVHSRDKKHVVFVMPTGVAGVARPAPDVHEATEVIVKDTTGGLATRVLGRMLHTMTGFSLRVTTLRATKPMGPGLLEIRRPDLEG